MLIEPFAEPLVAERGWRLRSNCKWAQLQTKRTFAEPLVARSTAESGAGRVAIAKQQQWAQLKTKRTIVEPEATRSIAESGAGGDHQ